MLSAASLIALAALAAGPDTLTLVGPDGAIGFGAAIAAAGDVDGDGRGDLLVGMPHYTDAFEEEGWVGLYLGKSVGLEKTPAWTMTGGQAFAHLGHAVAGLGDVDGDGRFDFAVGAPGFSRGADQEGIVYVWLGLPTDASPRSWSVEGIEPGARLGSSIAGVGDVDSDHHADLLIGAPGLGDLGRVQLHLGTPNGPTPFAEWFVDGSDFGTDPADDRIGYRIARALDTDGDGFSDFVVHTPATTLLFLGSEHIARTPDATLASSTSSLGDIDDSGQTALLANLLAAGDLNGDGYADAIALAPPNSRIALLAGSPTGLLPTPIRAGDCVCEDGPRIVVAAGDLDGDGMADIAIGSPNDSKIEIWRGRSSGLSSTPDWVAPGYQIVASAGDVNGDGHADLIAASTRRAAQYPDTGERAVLYLGSSNGFTTPPKTFAMNMRANFTNRPGGSLISPAGDVDGDGFSDVLVGYDAHQPVGYAGPGMISVFWGSPEGLLGPGSHRPPWVATGEPGDQLGARHTGAGDMDGDGLADFLVSSIPVGRGMVQLYLGGRFGPRRVWDSFSLLDSGNTPDPFPVGDLDGDGTSDFSIQDWYNASTDDNSILLGANGATTPREIGASVVSEAARFRIGVGDVNGDGFADLLTGSRLFGNWRGRSDLYLGSASSGVGQHIWSSTGTTGPRAPRWGRIGSPAGDLDSDGFADFMVHAGEHSDTREVIGRVAVYLGGPQGPRDTPDWTHDGELPWESMGDTMDVIGDVDGDGYSDIALGVWRGNLALVAEPRIRVFFGSRGLGFAPVWRPNFHLRDLSTFVRIQPGGRGTAAIGAYLVGSLRSAFGISRTALELEVKPFDIPFDGRDTLLTPYQPTTHEPSSILLPITHLETDHAYHWRVRLRYDPTQNPPQLGSHWIVGGQPGQLTSVHFRTGKNTPPTVEDAVFLGLGAVTGVSRNAPGLLAYARDPDVRDLLTATKVAGPNSGTATVFPDGTFFYKPDLDFSGIDSFQWRATDPSGASAIGTVTLHVEPGGACSAVSLTQCGRGRASAVLQTGSGLMGMRCRVIQAAEGRQLECDNRDGTLELTEIGPEICGGPP